MSKITIHNTVYWSTGDRVMSGKVKQVMADHAIVSAEGTDYIVRKASLSKKPVGRIASMVATAAMKDKPKAPKGIEWSFNPVTGESNVKWVDPTGEAGVIGCDASLHPEIGECDGIWVEDTTSAVTQLNPELFKNPKAPPPALPNQQKLPGQKAPAVPAPVPTPGIVTRQPATPTPAKPLPPQRRMEGM